MRQHRILRKNLYSENADRGIRYSQRRQEELRSLLRKLSDYTHQDMIVHNQFQPVESKSGVEFLVVKARGKFELPSKVWPAEKFRRNVRPSVNIRSSRQRCKFFRLHPLSPKNYAYALRPFLPAFLTNYYSQDRRDTPRGVPPVLLDSLSRQAPAAPDSTSHPSTGKISPQTPFEPEE